MNKVEFIFSLCNRNSFDESKTKALKFFKVNNGEVVDYFVRQKNIILEYSFFF